MTRGFITLAIGDYYVELAKNLINSYRLNQKEAYEFAVITDSRGAQVLDKMYDRVVQIGGGGDTSPN